MSDSNHPKTEELRVIDRRMFTPDGQPRHPDQPREEAHPAPIGLPRDPAVTAPRPEPARGAASTREEEVAAAHFKNLVLNLATTAAANLGEIPNPFSRQTEVELEGARQVIDLLSALQIKTRGNLTAEEKELMDSLLFDLRAKFVSLQSKAAKTS